MRINAATRAAVCFMHAENHYMNDMPCTGCAMYLEGLRILNEESSDIKPERFLVLAKVEDYILRKYVLGLGELVANL